MSAENSMPHPDKFWLVANTRAHQSRFGDYLTNPPKCIHSSEKSAEQEALRLALETGEEFVILESTARLNTEGETPRWEELV